LQSVECRVYRTLVLGLMVEWPKPTLLVASLKCGRGPAAR
jgi:hypothetical protein